MSNLQYPIVNGSILSYAKAKNNFTSIFYFTVDNVLNMLELMDVILILVVTENTHCLNITFVQYTQS